MGSRTAGLFVTRRASLRFYGGLLEAITVFSAFAVGFATGMSKGEATRLVVLAVGLSAPALASGLAMLALANRLVPHAWCKSPLTAIALCGAYLPQLIAGAAATTLVLLVRSSLFHYEALTWGHNLAFAIVVGLAWVFLGALAARIEDGELKAEQYLGEIEARAREVDRSRRRIMSAQERVKRDIAEQLQGRIKPGLKLVCGQLRELAALVDSPQGVARETITEAAGRLAGVIENDIRPLSRELHPSILNLGLPAALRSLFDQAEIEVDLDIVQEVLHIEDLESPGLPSGVRLAIYRFAQEALANAIRCGAARACIKVEKPDTDTIGISISAAGPEQKTFQHGRGTAHDYISAFGGVCSARMVPGVGSLQEASLPIRQEDPGYS